MSVKIPFIKAHGTGNDFIIFMQKNCPTVINNSKFIKQICKRKTGIGADGVLIISDISSNNFSLDYYNSDGTWETFCANGSRCAIKLLIEKEQIERKSKFTAGDGDHNLIVDENNHIWIQMKPPSYVTEEIHLFGYSGRHVDSGAKHFACEVSNLSEEIVQNFGPKIRFSKEFSPNGVNVNFSEKKSNNEINVITYEKGIEEVMLSCGSGSVASAFHLSKKYNLKSPLKINVPGGELNLKFNKKWDDVWISGASILLFESEFNEKDLPTIS